MSTYTIISFADTDSLREKIKDKYKDHYILKEIKNITFIRSDEITSQVTESLGMSHEEKALGIVVKHETCNGYADPSLWEWINKGG